MNFMENPEYDCESDKQAIRHITDECLSRKFALGITRINEVTTMAGKTLGIEI